MRGVAAGCRQAGCALIGGETAEHPGDFPKGEYDLAGFVVGVLEKKKMIDPAKIVAGDMLIGLPSSGLHSNGYSLARKVLLEKGRMKLHRLIPDLGRTLAEELLEPTRIYAKITRQIIREISRSRARRISPAAASREICRESYRAAGTRSSNVRAGRCRRSSSSFKGSAALPKTKWTALSTMD